MIGQPRFNICKLEDSRLPNAGVEDLPSLLSVESSLVLLPEMEISASGIA